MEIESGRKFVIFRDEDGGVDLWSVPKEMTLKQYMNNNPHDLASVVGVRHEEWDENSNWEDDDV